MFNISKPSDSTFPDRLDDWFRSQQFS